jgi:hypothetical protein
MAAGHQCGGNRPANGFPSVVLPEYRDVVSRVTIRKGNRQQLLCLIKATSHPSGPVRPLLVRSDADENKFLNAPMLTAPITR